MCGVEVWVWVETYNKGRTNWKSLPLRPKSVLSKERWRNGEVLRGGDVDERYR